MTMLSIEPCRIVRSQILTSPLPLDRTRIILGGVAFASLGYYLYDVYAPGPPSPEVDVKDKPKAVIGQ